MIAVVAAVAALSLGQFEDSMPFGDVLGPVFSSPARGRSIPPPQSGLVLWLDGSSVDLHNNATISDATSVSTWKNRSATTGDFNAVSANATPYANVNTGEGSVSFDGVYDQMVGANTGIPLNFISSTGVFDVFVSHRTRNTENGDARRLFGTAEGNTGLFVGLSSTLAGQTALKYWILVGNGTPAVMINHVTTNGWSLGAISTVLVRGDGVSLKTSSDFGTTFDTNAFSPGPTAGPTANDAGIGMILTTDTVGVQAYEGEYFQVLVYNRNLSASELLVVQNFIKARTPKGAYRTWAALGDSLTEGATGAFPWPARSTQTLRPLHIEIANKGKSGDTSSGANTRWTTDIKPYGAAFYGVNYNIGTNDLSSGTLATTIYANIVATETDIRAQGLKCILGTVSPQNSFGGWTGAMETQRLALNVSIRANTDCTIVDYDPIMWDPANHSNLNPAYDFGDHRHYNDTGMAAVSSTLNPLFQSL